jgi:hypothetical protein
MLLDGIRNAAVFAVGQSIVAAHDTLQFGKLADHAGQQVGVRLSSTDVSPGFITSPWPNEPRALGYVDQTV